MKDEGYHPVMILSQPLLTCRGDILFCYCGICEMRLHWKPQAQLSFRATCCGKIYDAIPASIDLSFYQLSRIEANLENVKQLKQRAVRIVRGKR